MSRKIVFIQLSINLVFSLMIKVDFARGAFLVNPKTCVVSLIPENQINERIKANANKIMNQMGYHKPEQRYAFYSNDPEKIRDCIERDFEDVIVIAHSSEVIHGHRSIIFFEPSPNGEGKWQVLPWRVFDRLKPGSELRQITLVICGAEDVVKEYSVLRRLARQYKIRLKLQLDSPTANLLLWTRDLRAGNLFAALIAESAQSENAKNVFCLIRTKVIFIYEHGESSCLRNRFQIRFHGPLSVGLKTSTRWMQMARDSGKILKRLSLVDLELGLGRSAAIGISKNPLQSHQETYGFSVSPVTFVTIDKQKKEFADESVEEIYETM